MKTRALPLFLAASLFSLVPVGSAEAATGTVTDPQGDVEVTDGFEGHGLADFDLRSVDRTSTETSFTITANLTAVKGEPTKHPDGTITEQLNTTFLHRDGDTERRFVLNTFLGDPDPGVGASFTDLSLAGGSSDEDYTLTPQQCDVGQAVTGTSIAVTVPFSCLGRGTVRFSEVYAWSSFLANGSDSNEVVGQDHLLVDGLEPVEAQTPDPCAGKSLVSTWSKKTSAGAAKVGRTAKISRSTASACGRAAKVVFRYRWCAGTTVVSTSTSYKPARKYRGKKLTVKVLAYRGRTAAATKSITFGTIRK